jgi:hypothetical protein
MDDLARLRDQLAGLGGRQNPQAGQGQPGQSQLNRNGQAGQNGNQPGQNGQGGQNGQNGQGGQNGQSARNGQGGQNGQGTRQGGVMGDRVAGPTGGPGGNRTGTIYGDLDTGNTRISGRAVMPQQGPNPADTQREIEQGLNLLNGIRPAVQESPEARQQLQLLVDEMRSLDPKRFPGNPALVEQMRQQLTSTVDALELQLRHQLEQDKGGTIRNADPTKVPAGYQDSVAEYYRKLSSGTR